MSNSGTTLTGSELRSQVRKAAVASTIGTTIEWYDYFLYGAAAALVFPHVFFPEMPAYLGLLAAFGTYFVGFLARPVGAAIFGSWGYAAPVILIVLRVFQGVAVGGEWGGSILLSMEWGNQKRRGLMASWPQLGVAIGIILSTGLMAIFNGLLGTDAFIEWGWRIPFLLSLVLVAVGLYIRIKIEETPMFRKVLENKTAHKSPVFEVLRKYPKQVVLSALLRMSEQMPFYIVTAFVLSYLTDDSHKYTYNFVLIGTMVAAFLELFLVPYFGHLSDTVGRKKIYLIGAGITGVWGFVYFALLDSGIAWLVFFALVVALIPHAMQYGPQASIIAENFPTNLRYTGAGLGYQLSSIIAGGPAALVATYLLHTFGTGYAVSVYILVSALITIAAAFGLKDYSKADISSADTYEPRETAAERVAS